MKSAYVKYCSWKNFHLLTIALVLGIILIPATISAADGGSCSLTGKWTRTDGDDIYTFNTDGTATTLHWGSQIHNGVWVGNGRSYTISWEHGPRSGEHYIDYATIAPDCNSYGGINNFGDRFNTIRINPLPQQPVSASDIIGVWQRTDGADIYTVFSDGRITTVLNGQTYTGHWQKKDAGFIFDWDIRPSGRKYIDTVTLSSDSFSFFGTNNEGYHLNAKKIGMPLAESISTTNPMPTVPTTTLPADIVNEKPAQPQESTNGFSWIIPLLVVGLIAGGVFFYLKRRPDSDSRSADSQKNPAGSKRCDLCGRPISASEMTVIPQHDFQRAVQRGFNPFETPEINMSIITIGLSVNGISAEQYFPRWRQNALNDPTDWGLCQKCAEAFRMNS